MEYKKYSQNLERTNFFKNIALRATEHCLKSFDSNELTEDEEKCLKKSSLALYFIVERNRFENYMLTKHPSHPW